MNTDRNPKRTSGVYGCRCVVVVVSLSVCLSLLLGMYVCIPHQRPFTLIALHPLRVASARLVTSPLLPSPPFLASPPFCLSVFSLLPLCLFFLPSLFPILVCLLVLSFPYMTTTRKRNSPPSLASPLLIISLLASPLLGCPLFPLSFLIYI